MTLRPSSKSHLVGAIFTIWKLSAQGFQRVSLGLKIFCLLPLLMVTGYSHAAGWQLTSTQYEKAKMPLEVIAPRAGLSTANRYYKAYPGLKYRVPVVVLGGAYPYQYTITSGPSGMTVGQHYGDADYGIINYPNPVAGTYTVTVSVTDQQGTVSNVTWPLTVTTSGFIFIDSVNGHASSANGGTGAGTLANPFRTLDDWYSGAAGGSGSASSRKADRTYAGYFVYYRAGNYSTVDTYHTEGAETGYRMPCVGGNKPKVHLAYPGEVVNFDSTNGAWIYYSDSTGNYYFAGMNWTVGAANGDNKALEWDSGSSINDVGVFEATFKTPSPSAGTNAAAVMSRNGGSVGNYIFLSHNTFSSLNGYDAFLGYFTNKFVAQNNTVSNATGGAHGFYAKINNANWSIRANTGLVGNANALYTVDGYSTSNNIEVAWNNYKTSGDGALFGLTPSTTIGNVWQYRNTWQIGQQHIVNVSISNLVLANDVVTYKSGNAHGWYYDNQISAPSVTASFTGEECVKLGSGCTDASGNLTGSATTYIGLRGHIPASSSSSVTAAPSAPQLTVQVM